jgi:large subunit ribosomal protein L17
MARIELVEGETLAQSVVGEAERSRGTRFAGRRPLTGRVREVSEELAGESPTAAAALAADAEDTAAAEAAETDALETDAAETDVAEDSAGGIPGEGGELEAPEGHETDLIDVPTEGDTDSPESIEDVAAPEVSDEAPEKQAESASEESQAEGDR